MAKLGNIVVNQAGFSAGAAFLLTQPCKTSVELLPDSTSHLILEPDNPYVVVHVREAHSPFEAFDASYEIAQQGLDLLSARGKANLSIRNAAQECLIWWHTKPMLILRVISTATLSVTMSTTTLTVIGATEEKKAEAQPATPVYHHSLRYFRLSQVTDDLFDSYRNMWLAFESLLSSRYPKDKKETEKAWLKRALKDVEANLPLEQSYTPLQGMDLVPSIIKELYTDTRLALFHAKDHEAYLVPLSSDDRYKVAKALSRLARIVLLLIEHWLKIRRGGGAVTSEGFNVMTRPILESGTVLVSDNDAEESKDETLSHPAYANAVAMHTRYAPELSAPGTNVVLGVVPGTQLQPLQKIARFGLESANKLFMVSTLSADLWHEGIDLLEAQLAVTLNNIQQPRQRFSD